MPKRLTEAQQAAYQRDGFVAPIDIFTADEVAQIHAELDAAEAAHGEQLQAAGRNNAHYVLPVLDRIAHDQRIIDAVEDVIGPDILVAGTTLFIKEPDSSRLYQLAPGCPLYRAWNRMTGSPAGWRSAM